MPHLEHVFAAGIRFDTEVQYLARTRSGLRYERLPLRKMASARACALESVVHCVLILGQLPRARWLARVHRAANQALEPRGTLVDDIVLRTIQAVASEMATVAAIEAEPFASAAPAQLGKAALDALRARHLCLLRFESPQSSRWAPVIGVEAMRGSGQVRTLLLLDSSASEPWACAHNVRIELSGGAGPAVNAKPGLPLNCRHLTGEASAVRLSRLLVVKRR